MAIKLIGKISCTPEVIVPGQSVFIEVNSLDGSNFKINDAVTVRINGVIGPNQYLQFNQAGKKIITISAAKEKKIETQNLEIDVIDIKSPGENSNNINTRFMAISFNPKVRSLPILNITRSHAQPYKSVFSVGSSYLKSKFFSEPSLDTLANENSKTLKLSGESFASSIKKELSFSTGKSVLSKTEGNTEPLINQALKGSEFLHNLFTNTNTKSFTEITNKLKSNDKSLPKFVATPIPGGITVEPLTSPEGLNFYWDFGNGASLVTQELSIEHDYESSLDPNVEHNTFHVKCRITEKGQPDIEVARTLYIHNAYALCKKMGSIVPKTFSSVFATKAADGWEGSVTINNVESFSITLTSKLVYPLMNDGNHLTVPVAAGLGNVSNEPLETNKKASNLNVGTDKKVKASSLIKKISLNKINTAENQTISAVVSKLVLNQPIIIPAKGSISLPITVPRSVLTEDSIGFVVVHTGVSPEGHKIYSEAFFDIPAKDRANNSYRVGDIALKNIVTQNDVLLNHAGDSTVTKSSSSKTSFSTNAKLFGLNAGHAFISSSNVRPDAMPNAEKSILLNSASNTSAPNKTSSNLSLLHDLITPVPSNIEEKPSYEVSVTIQHLLSIGLLSDGSQLADVIKTKDPVVNEECDPDNTPDEIADDPDSNWACQATPETRQIVTQPRFLNARKGDVVLSPGGPGLIGQLLRQVSPAQLYSHSGIMTRNYDQITHCTASEDRMLDYPVGSVPDPTILDPLKTAPGPSDGYRPDVVKYGWPGIITQSVAQTVFGSPFTDPESGKVYNISGFSGEDTGANIGGTWEIIHPIVIRPDYILESKDIEIRKKLHAVANDAAAQTGKGHYRFYCYTDPTIVDDESKVGPADSGWAKGTIPLVCSSFIWHTLKKNNVHLESDNEFVSNADLEVSDKVVGTAVVGGEVGVKTKDGLYLYHADERLAGAQYLHNALKNKVDSKLKEKGILGEAVGFFSDMEDDVANQIVNAFASDWCDTEAKDSDDWKNTSDANAVSPDNIFLWDSPEQKGLYGSYAPLVYRESRIETVTIYKWQKVLVKGSLSGTVRYNGDIKGDVLVQLYDGMTTASDENGRYFLQHVPLGSYQIKASYTDSNGTYFSANMPVNINSSQNTFDIDLQGPSDLFRKLKIEATINIFDYKEIGHNQSNTEQFYREIYVGPYGTHGETSMSTSADDGDNVGSFRVVADWNTDKSIYIQFFHSMEEGGDNEGNSSNSFALQADYWQSWTSTIGDPQIGGSDTSRVDVVFTNEVNPH